MYTSTIKSRFDNTHRKQNCNGKYANEESVDVQVIEPGKRPVAGLCGFWPWDEPVRETKVLKNRQNC